jgi:hypothetical protein
MPQTPDDRWRRPHDGARQPVMDPQPEGAGFYARPPDVPDAALNPHAGFDAELNPIDDEHINTHGSER